MRIALFSGDISRGGGTERAGAFLASYLSKEHQVFIVNLAQSSRFSTYYIEDEVEQYSLNASSVQHAFSFRIVQFRKRLRDFLLQEKPDVLIDIDIVLDAISVPAARGTKVKIISWEHFHLGYEKSVWYRRWILEHFTRRTDFSVVLTKRDANAYRQFFGAKRSIHCIPNAFPFEEDGLPQRNPYAQEKNPNRQIITIGRLTKQKGIKRLLPIAKRILDTFPDWKWILLGEGELRDCCEKYILKHGLEHRLILRGYTPQAMNYLLESDIYVMTSEWEGLPYTLLEAKACHVPMVAFDVKTGPGELIRNGENGYLIPPFQEDEMVSRISELIEKDSLRRNFGSRTMEHSQMFFEEDVKKKWRKLLDNIG